MIGPIQRGIVKTIPPGKAGEASNPLRALKGAVDFSFVRPRVEEVLRAGRSSIGRPDCDPETDAASVLRQCRQRAGVDANDRRRRLDYLWFLGLRVTDDESSRSQRDEQGAARDGERRYFEELFVETVKQCVEAGLVDGSKIHMDGSLVDASASNKSMRRGPAELIEALRKVYRQEERQTGTAGWGLSGVESGRRQSRRSDRQQDGSGCGNGA